MCRKVLTAKTGRFQGQGGRFSTLCICGTNFCSCDTGFTASSSCAPNSCTCAPGRCAAGQSCTSGPTCSCSACPGGYTSDGNTCSDINECPGSPCAGGYTCNNNPGSYTCDDVNECLGSPCAGGYTCNNNPGSYTCDDVNECLGSPCAGGYTCNNNPGSYTCDDVNECLGSPCGGGYTCSNTPGSYNCNDINECATGNGGCSTSPLVTCTNTPGSRTCAACPAGYSGSGVGPCTACSPGSYSLGGGAACTSCPTGSYCPSTTSGPVSCPAGQTCSTTGLTAPNGSCAAPNYSTGGASSCSSCPAGLYCPVNNAAPLGCTAPNWSNAGQTACTACAPGFACPTNTGQTQCVAGTYSPGGQTSCSTCSAPNWSSAGASGCNSCAAGNQCPSNTAQTPCGTGSYSGAGQTSCTSCPAGSYCATTGLSSPTGTCTAPNYSTGGASSCSSCPAGSYCPVGNAAPLGCTAPNWSNAGQTACTACAPGFACPTNTGQTQCTAGSFSAGGQTTCTSCPAGSYCATNGLSTPTGTCTAPNYSTGGASSCSSCPAGSYCPVNNAAPLTCTAPNWSNAGQTACTTCAPGFACPSNTGQTQCTAGSFSAGGQTTCTSCPAGSYCATNGLSTATGTCTAPNYSTGGAASCSSCPAGSYCPVGNAAPLTCTAPNWSNAGQTACTTCAAGYACPSNTGQTQCTAGSFSAGGQTTCTTCTAGSYCSTNGLSAPTGQCPAGSYSAGGASTPSCTSCPAGKYCSGTGNTAFTGPCAANTYSTGGATTSACTACPANQFSATSASSCTNCPAGQQSTSGGPCTACPAGWTSLSGSSCTIDLDECTMGTHTCDVPAKAQCTNTAGSFTCACLPGFTGSGQVSTCMDTNNQLASLALDISGPIAFGFTPTTTTYSVAVNFLATTALVTPTRASPYGGTITVQGSGLASGATSPNIALSPGPNTLTIVMTPQSGPSRTYTISVNVALESETNDLSALTVSAGAISPTFTSGVTTYTLTVPYTTSSSTCTATLLTTLATLKINTVSTPNTTPSAALALTVGSSNVFSVEVRSQTGLFKTYTVTITRQPDPVNTLQGITPSTSSLAPAFASATLAYTVTVPYTVTTLDLTPSMTSAVSTMTANGSPQANLAPYTASSLIVGNNVVTIVVTPQSLTPTKTYTVTIVRQPDTNNDLATLSISPIISITPAFSAGVTAYTVAASYPTASVTFSATASSVVATISGSTSPVALPSFEPTANTITVTVTSQSGAPKTYTVSVLRARDTNNDLTMLALKPGSGSISFATGTTSYSVTVPYGVMSTTLRAIMASANGNLKYQQEAAAPVAIAGNTETPALSLTVGVNTLAMLSFAQDGSPAKTYTVTVTRSPNVCGDAYMLGTSGETCDDGNVAAGDGCSPICIIETGYSCTGITPSVCTDNNECTIPSHNCHVQATCTNLPGTFSCACKTNLGWGGDGVTCTLDTIPVSPSLLCLPGTLTGVSVGWTPLVNPLIPVTYMVSVAGAPGGPVNVTQTAQSANVTVPTASTTYAITVTPFNVIGAGPASLINCDSGKSDDSRLARLSLLTPGVVLSPAFSPNVTAYTTAGSYPPSLVLGTTVNSTCLESHGTLTTTGTTGLTPGFNTITVRCTAHNGVNFTTYTIQFENPNVPVAPAPPTFAQTTFNGTLISWVAPSARGSAITSYAVYRNGTQIAASVPATQLSFYDEGPLQPLTRYVYTVTATNAVGPSSPSAPGAADTTYPPPTITSVAPLAAGAAGGVPITLLGSFFGLTSSALTGPVSVAGVPAPSFTWLSENSMLVICPPLPDAVMRVGKIVVTTSAGTSQSPSDFTILATKPPTPLGLTCQVQGGSDSLAVVFTLGGSVDADVAGVRVTLLAFNATTNATTPLVQTVPRAALVAPNSAGSTVFAGLSPSSSYTFYASSFTPYQDSDAANVTCFTPDPIAPGLGLGVAALPLVYSITPTSGSQIGGTNVTITGANLGATPLELQSITVAGVPCTYSKRWISNSTVACVTEAAPSPGSGKVVVGTFAGVSKASATAAVFEYVVPDPQVLDIRPRVFNAAGGTTVTIRGNFLGLASDQITAAVSGLPCATTTWVSSTEILCVTPPQPSGLATSAADIQVTVNGRQSVPATSSSLSASAGFMYGLECIPMCDWNGRCVDGVCTGCVDGFTNPPACNVPLISVAPRETPPLFTTEDGLRSVTFEIKLGASPVTQDVVIETVVSNPAEAMASPAMLTISPATWSANPLPSVKISGLDDKRRDGNTTYSVQFIVRSGPSAFVTAPALPSFRLVNNDTSPRVEAFEPALASMVGQNISVVFRNLDPAFSLAVGGLPARVLMDVTNFPELTADNFDAPAPAPAQQGGAGNATARLFAQLQAASAAPALDSTQRRLIVEVPFGLPKGYTAVTVVNGGGSWGSNGTALFVTDDCPQKGYYGVGTSCKPCPVGGICPGGNRIWPQAGYWTPSEDAGFVAACDPPEACAGGQSNECRVGHVRGSRMCSLCEDQYYSLNGLCQPCPARESVAFFALADAILWSLFAVAVVTVKDRMTLSYCVMTVKALQQIGGIGSSSTGKLPRWLLEVYSVLHFFSGDYSFLKPDCLRPAPFFETFFYSLAYNCIIFTPVFVALPLARTISLMRARRRKEEPEVYAARVHYWRDRFTRSIYIWMSTIYLSVVALCFEAISCQRRGDGKFYMITRPDDQCYVTRPHLILCAVAVLLLLAFAAGYPIGMLIWLRRKKNRELLHNDERFMERYNVFYEFFNPKSPYGWILDYPISCVVAAGKSYLKPNINYQMSVSVAVFGLKLLYIIARRPYIDTATDFIQGGLAIIALVAINLNFLTRAGLLNKTPKIAEYIGMGIIVLIGLVVVGLVCMIVYLVLRPPQVLITWKEKREEEREREQRRLAILAESDSDSDSDDGEGKAAEGQEGFVGAITSTVSKGWNSMLQAVGLAAPPPAKGDDDSEPAGAEAPATARGAGEEVVVVTVDKSVPELINLASDSDSDSEAQKSSPPADTSIFARVVSAFDFTKFFQQSSQAAPQQE